MLRGSGGHGELESGGGEGRKWGEEWEGRAGVARGGAGEEGILELTREETPEAGYGYVVGLDQ
jgi:hypothetical protein